MNRKGIITAFTLIELLIVVAIIAILAAIAVPNFLEAQVRSKVSRVKADMRSIATAIESYSVDTNHYPFDFADDTAYPYYLNRCITTPIAYMTNAARMKDVFAVGRESGINFEVRQRFRYRAFKEKWLLSRANGGYWGSDLPPGGYDAPGMQEARRVHGAWFLVSKGPRGTLNLPTGFNDGNNLDDWLWLPYDPTNGTRSPGQVMRSQKLGDVNPVGYDRYAATYFVLN